MLLKADLGPSIALLLLHRLSVELHVEYSASPSYLSREAALLAQCVLHCSLILEVGVAKSSQVCDVSPDHMAHFSQAVSFEMCQTAVGQLSIFERGTTNTSLGGSFCLVLLS